MYDERRIQAEHAAAQATYEQTRSSEHDAERIRAAQNPEQAAEFVQLSAATKASRKAAMEEGLFTLFARYSLNYRRNLV